VNKFFFELLGGTDALVLKHCQIAFLPTMNVQLSQLPMMVGSGRVHSTTRPFFCLPLFHFSL